MLNFSEDYSEIYGMSDTQIIAEEIRRFMVSKKRADMLTGEMYYMGKHDILTHNRTIIGTDGNTDIAYNLPNNRIVDNQYKKMVTQKNNYLLGKDFTVRADDKRYLAHLDKLFDKKFMHTLRCVGQDCLNCGIGWVFFGYDEHGKVTISRIAPWEIIPQWADNEHTELEYAIRVYSVITYEGTVEQLKKYVEVYHSGGIEYFEWNGKSIVPCAPYHKDYFAIKTTEGERWYNWDRIPLIPFRCNRDEMPLINSLKTLQDALNMTISGYQNRVEEDAHNTILVLVNYDGENLGEFRKNLATYGAVKVTTVDGAGGDLKTLQLEINPENYKALIAMFKKAIIENAMGYDAKDDRIGSSANRLNIRSMYSDIDLDACAMESEFSASLQMLCDFITLHLCNVGKGDYRDERAEITFNRDMLMNESEIIADIKNSADILSRETLLAMHPYVSNIEREMQRIANEN